MPDDRITSAPRPHDLERLLVRELDFIDAASLAILPGPEPGCDLVVLMEVTAAVRGWADLAVLGELVRENLTEFCPDATLGIWMLEEGVLPRRQSTLPSEADSVDRERARLLLRAHELPWLARVADGAFESRAQALAVGGPNDSHDSRGASSPTARELAELAASLLQVAHLAPSDHLFARGADSIACVRLVARVRDRWGVSLETGDVFDAPRIAELAERIDALRARAVATAETHAIVRADRARAWPLSAAQMRIWLVSQLETSGPAQHVAGGLRLRGALDRGALLRAARALAQRHEVLRTVIDVDAGVQAADDHGHVAWVVQRVLPEMPLVLHERPRAAGGEALSSCVRAAAEAPFDLRCGPLWRLELQELGPGDHLLVLCIHHVITDGWSMELAARELLQLYAAELAGARHAAQLPALPLQFIDYVVWETRRRQDDRAERQLDYWRDQLGGAPEPLELPRTRARQDRLVPSGRAGARVALEFEPALTAGLRALAAEQGTTLFVVLLAAFQLWLARMTGRDDIRVGVPVLGRQRVETEGLIGCFINTLVLRTRLDRTRPARALVREVDATLRAALAHADVPFDAVVKALSPERSADRNPLFQVMYNHLRVSQHALDVAARDTRLQVERIARDPIGAPFELTLETEEDDAGQLRALFVYPVELFDPETVREFASLFDRMLNALAAEPARPLAELELIPVDVLARWSEPHRRPLPSLSDEPVHALVLRQARRRPGAIAIVGAGERWTFGELDASSQALARELRERGVGPEVPVGIFVPRGPRMIVAALAIWRAGGAYVPLDPSYPAARLHFIVQDAGLRLVITGEGVVDLPAEVACLPMPARTERGDAADETWPGLDAAIHPEQLAYVIYTSGSTGQPKGVSVAHGSLAMHCREVGALYEMSERDCSLHFASFSFDAAVEQWTVPLAHGARLVLSDAEAWTGEQTYEVVQREAVTIVYPPTSHLRLLAQHALMRADEAGVSGLRLRVCCVGGEAVSREDHALITRGLSPERFINGYGPTECVVTPLLWRSFARDTPESGYVPIGRAVGARRVYVLDHELTPVAPGVIGEIYIGGSGLARGYHARTPLTAASFIPDPWSDAAGGRLYRTGDLGRWRQSGDVEYVGRRDEQVKLRGYRIELGEIESRLREHAAVSDAVVVVVTSGDSHKRLVGYVETSAASDASLVASLRAQLSARLPEYMIPAQLITLLELPKTPNGKVDRKALPAPETLAARSYLAPTGDVEHVLVAIWAELLGVAAVGLDDNFFELGGDSIAALQLVDRARAQGIVLRARSVFEYQSVRELAASSEPVRAAVLVARAPQSGRVSLTPIQSAFLALPLPRPDHYNQALLLGLRRKISPQVLAAALRIVIERHPALRLSLRSLEPHYLPAHDVDGASLVECHDVASDEQARTIIEAVQRSLDLSQGRLVRAALLCGAPGDRLLLVIHHLAVDGVSFRVLLEDLAGACAALEAAQEPALRSPTTDCGRWAERLQAWAHEPELIAQLGYWRAQLQPEACRLQGVAPICDRVGDCERLSLRVDPARTTRLLREAGRAYRMRPHELLLTALVRAVQRWNGQRKLAIQLETHGRESPWPEFDLSRSVGWFTCVHPLALGFETEIGAHLRAIKERIRRVPDAGLGYGVLCELGDPTRRAALAGRPEPAITFNYLGRFDDSFDAQRSPFELLSLEPGASVDPDALSASPIVVDGWVVAGELTLRWTVSPSALPLTAANALVAAFDAQLSAVLEHGADAAPVLTPADLTYVKLAQTQLDALAVRASAIAQVYPTSALQAGMLFHAAAEPGSAAYVNTLAFELTGASLDALEAAFQAAVARHIALRSGFVWQAEAGPLQLVMHQARLPVTRADLRTRSDPAAARADACRAERAQPFELSRAPLARLYLGQLADDRALVIWTSHHLALDGWSAARLLAEVLAAARGDERAHMLQPSAASSHEALLAWRAGHAGPDDEAFWRERVRALEEPTLLAEQLPRLSDAEAESEAHFRLAGGDYERVCHTARALRVTPNTLVQAAWLLLLQRLTGHDVVSCGVVVSGRPAELPMSEALVGMYVNTLPLVHRVEPAEPIATWLRRLMRENLALRDHEHASLIDIQRWAALPGRRLFDSLIVYENYPIAELLRGSDRALAPAAIEVIEQTSYPFTLRVQLAEAGLDFVLAYPRARLSPALATRLTGWLSGVLGQIARAPERCVGEIDLLDREGARRLAQGNATAHALGSRAFVAEWISEQARARPSATALVYGAASRSYAELEERTQRLAQRLRELGVGPEQRVAVLAERSFELVESLVATLKAGGAYVPLDPELPAERLASMLADTAPRVLLAQRAQLDRHPAFAAVPCLILDEPDWLERSSGPIAVAQHPDHLAYVIYTSGSTGKPKAAANTQRGLANRLAWMQATFALGGDDVVLQKTPYSFDVSVWEFFWPLMTGSTLVLAAPGDQRDPARMARLIAQHGVTTLHFVPSMLQAFLAHADTGACGSLRRVICSGEALDGHTAARCRQQLPAASLHNLYGPTEVAIDVTHWACETDERSVPIGRPIWNTAVYVLDAHLQRAPLGAVGELYLAGAGLARGYHARPALTAERFVPDPWGAPSARMYRTGDLGRIRDDGAIECLGRTDQQLKLRGFRIEPGEIEAVLRAHPEVRDAVVVALEQAGTQRLVGYVAAPVSRANSLKRELVVQLDAQLPAYMVPAQLVVLETLAYTSSGKLDRRALPAPELASQARSEPKTALEALLLEVWRSVLHAPDAGVEDDFFALGGDSLLSLQIIARARQRGLEISAKQLFEARSVASLAAAVGGEEGQLADAGSHLAPIARAQRSDWMPLSHAQERLWFLAQLEPDSSAYNVSGALRLRGALEVGRLHAALEQLVRRHEALRTSFEERGERGMQRVSADAEVVLRRLSVRGPDAESRARCAFAAETLAPFRLADPSLLRLLLIELGEHDHVLVVTMHHLISDGGTVALLVDELRETYARPGQLEPLELQYVDYAAWQRSALTPDELARQLAYWREQLGDEHPVIALPLDRPRPPAQSYRGASVGFVLDRATSEGIARLGQELGASLFMVLLAAFESLLYRWSGQRELRVGVPVSHRSRVELERIAGLFVNTLVLPARLRGELTFVQLIAQVKQTTLDAQAHRDLPFERLVEALAPERSLSHNPLFQVMFDHQRAPLSTLRAMGELSVTAFECGERATQLDLTLETADDAGQIRGTFTYATDLFDPSTIEALSARLARVLHQVVQDPHVRLSELDVLGARERSSLMAAALPVVQKSWTEHVFVHAQVAAQAQRRPDAIALEGERAGDALTYAQLERLSNQWAQLLRAQGVGPEDKIGLCVGRSPRMVVGALAILKAGGAYVSLDPSYPLERLRTIVADAQLQLIVGERAQPMAAELGVARCVWLDADDVSAELDDAPEVALSGENLAYVVYTSGSTGRPKGVGVSHVALAQHIAAIGADYGMTAADCALHFASMSFDAGVEQWASPLTHGARLFIRGDALWSAERAVSVLREHAVSWFEMPPAYLREVAQAALDRSETLRLRACTAGGEAVSRENLRLILAAIAPAPLINGYGPTESVITPMTWHATDAAECATAYAPIGRVIGPRRSYVLDADLNLVPIGVTGELHLGGSSQARGYLNQPGWTAERFVPDPYAPERGSRMYRTGDLARVRADASVEYLGRDDHQIKLRGFRVELGELESQLLAQPGVREAAVVAQGGALASRLIGYVTGEVDVEQLRSQLRAALPEYMLPSQLIVLDALPRNSNGKLDRKRLPEPEALREVYVAPRTPHEAKLCAIFAEVLSATRVGASDNFFALGGDSIRSLQVVSRARRLGIALRPRDLFEQQTVEALARVAKPIAPDAGAPPLRALPRTTDRFVLSHAQERLWFLAQLEPDSAAYNIAGALRVHGALDLTALQVALDRLSARHESLRTTFEARDGRPWQRVHAALDLTLRVHDLRGAEPAQAEQRARAHVEALAHTPLELTGGPLCRVAIVRLSEDEQVLCLVMHHIISDGWSIDLAIAELSELYVRAHALGPAQAALPALPLQYVDYAAWQRESLAAPELARQLEYWQARLGSADPVLALPADRPRPATPSHRGGVVDVAHDAALGTKLRALGRAHDATPFMLLLAAWQTLLHRLTGACEIRVGVPVTHRNRIETERVIGLFVNTQVLRGELDPSQSFAQIVRATREHVLAAQANQDLPFERLVEVLSPARSLSHNPLFQVMYNHLRRADELFGQVPELQVSPFEWQSQLAQFDLTLDTEEDLRGAFSGRLTYASDLFDRTTVERWSRQFVRLLGLLLDEPATALGALPWLEPHERGALLDAGARRELIAGGPLLHERIRAQAQCGRARIACSFEGERLSYGALELRANQWAHRLRALGVGPEVRVGLCVERSLDLIVGLLAILKAGGAYVPLDPAAPADRLAFMIDDSQVGLVLSQDAHASRLAELPGLRLLCLDREDVRAEPSYPPAIASCPDQLAYVIYTSGSTGKPKAALLTHRNVTRLFDATQRWFGFDERDVWTLFHSYAFDFSVWELFGALLYGGSLVIVPHDVSRSPSDFHALLVRERVSVLNQTPSAFRQLSAAACAAPESALALRLVIFGGEALELETLRPWFERFGDARPQLVNMYGITETTVHVTYRPLRRADLDRVACSPIGEPIVDLSLYVLDAALEPCAWGAIGELYVGGDGLARGYLGRPALTAERFIPNPFGPGRLYRSGDHALRRSDGSLEYLGRSDHQVKIRGFRIELGEIAAQLQTHTLVRDAVVLARPGPSGQRLVGYVVLRADASVEALAVLKGHLRSALPEYMVPATLIVLPELPLTVNGKLDRSRLPEPVEQVAGYIAARTPAEAQLAAIWAELLGVARVGASDDFFALGGHSLLAAQVVSRVQQQLGVLLPLRELFEATTLRALAERIAARSAEATAQSKLDALDALLTDLENES